MEKSIKIQVGLPMETHEQFEDYRRAEKLTVSEAGRRLIDLALRVVNNSSDDSISNRELLELLLLQANKNVLFTKKLLKSGIDEQKEKDTYPAFVKAESALEDKAKSATETMLKS
ncbi:hypothetical protein [Vibrio cyclitrophicus]|uniref:Uncharacterized protein n=2 Tax=Vibrio cyclitrophicus TaxID=47951 RepID=A0A7Z1MK75_9VIBR|nr:hypothetical protein [Vibrio cyclitrophicus]PMP21115.1 hypothetical protein BCS91_20500 [Vibrio cyclitrophicus]PMP30539.1 hypothetical protein BCS90_14655 [Vibrio cyclitrophicus]